MHRDTIKTLFQKRFRCYVIIVLQKFIGNSYFQHQENYEKIMKRMVLIEVKYLQKDEINYILMRFICQIYMIGLNNRNYSFIAISKHPNSKKNSLDSTLNKIFSPTKTTNNLRNKDKDANITYASPSSHQINGFKNKLSIYIHRRSYQPDKINKNNHKEAIFSMAQTFMNDKVGFYRSSSRRHSEGTEKRKNIREYITQISKEKRKVSQNKPTQSHQNPIKQQQKQKCNPILIIKKLKRSKDGRKNTISESYNIFKQREGPIHHTKIYYFSKEKSRTEPIETSIDKNDQKKQKKQVTLSRIIKLREELNLKEAEKISEKVNSELLIINQIHPTVAIITARKSDRKNLPKQSLGDKQLRVSSKAEINKKIKLKQEQEISPWKRKNHNQFQLF